MSEQNYSLAIKEAESTFNSLENCELDFNKEKYFALQICEANTALQNKNILYSLTHAVRNVALCGITLNPALKLAYIVPRGGKACLDISYMGLIKIATDSGSVTKVNCQLVYENDFFEIEHGTNARLTHKPDVFSDRGELKGVYVIATLHDGSSLVETMSMAQIADVKKRSKASSGPWITDTEEMVRKTCVKRASKYWPKTERLAEAVNVLNEHEGFTELSSPGTEAAEKAKAVETSDEDLQKRSELIETLEEVAKGKGLQGYGVEWKKLTADNRKLIGANEHERLKAIAKDNTDDAGVVSHD